MQGAEYHWLSLHLARRQCSGQRALQVQSQLQHHWGVACVYSCFEDDRSTVSSVVTVVPGPPVLVVCTSPIWRHISVLAMPLMQQRMVVGRAPHMQVCEPLG